MRIAKKLTGFAAVAAMSAGVVAPAPATAVATAQKKEDCVVSDPAKYNGQVYSVQTRNGNGSAIFKEYGDELTVSDHSSDGKRTIAVITRCYNGKWVLYKDWETFNSGPNEGKTDRETYKLHFKEGRRLKITVFTAVTSNQGDVIEAVA